MPSTVYFSTMWKLLNPSRQRLLKARVVFHCDSKLLRLTSKNRLFKNSLLENIFINGLTKYYMSMRGKSMRGKSIDALKKFIHMTS